MFKQYTIPDTAEQARETLREVEEELYNAKAVAALADCASWDLRIRELTALATQLRQTT